MIFSCDPTALEDELNALLVFSVRSGLPADTRGERCGHNYVPSQCPYSECGYREALGISLNYLRRYKSLLADLARIAGLPDQTRESHVAANTAIEIAREAIRRVT